MEIEVFLGFLLRFRWTATASDWLRCQCFVTLHTTHANLRRMPRKLKKLHAMRWEFDLLCKKQ